METSRFGSLVRLGFYHLLYLFFGPPNELLCFCTDQRVGSTYNQRGGYQGGYRRELIITRRHRHAEKLTQPAATDPDRKLTVFQIGFSEPEVWNPGTGPLTKLQVC